MKYLLGGLTLLVLVMACYLLYKKITKKKEPTLLEEIEAKIEEINRNKNK